MKCKAQPRFYTPRPGHRDCPNFKRWSIERLRKEAKRLDMPGWEHQVKSQLVRNLIDAYT